MRSEKYLWNICMDIYRQMYKEATPSADLDKLIDKGITKEENWFMDYNLNQDRQEEIISIWCGRYRCSKQEAQKISCEVLLGSAPRG